MSTNLQTIKQYISAENVRENFQKVLGAKAPQFLASLLSACTSNKALGECQPGSVIAAAYIAASLDLPIDSNLGFSAIVPYGKQAQFQMMYKGYIQLAIRTGLYTNMNCSEVYEDELECYNPITGECTFADFKSTEQRAKGESDKVIGYYAWFKMANGFTKSFYMTTQELTEHAKKYSASYRAGRTSRWSTDFSAMAKKTVIKLLLSKWGALSIEMQKAIADDQKVYNEGGEGEYSDNKQEQEAIIDPFTETKEEVQA